jgi:CHASE2 domain-containing sensor protein
MRPTPPVEPGSERPFKPTRHSHRLSAALVAAGAVIVGASLYWAHHDADHLAIAVGIGWTGLALIASGLITFGQKGGRS